MATASHWDWARVSAARPAAMRMDEAFMLGEMTSKCCRRIGILVELEVNLNMDVYKDWEVI